MTSPLPQNAHWAALAHAVRGRALMRLFRNFSTGEEAWNANSKQLAALGLHTKALERIAETQKQLRPEAVWERMKTNQIEAITINDDGYPKLLKQIPDAPAVLFRRGQTTALNDFPLGIVGTRKFSDYGKTVTIQFGRQLVRAGFTLVSGLARGVDGLAHEAAIDTGGHTAAVIGSGLDKGCLYPREHWRLSEAIVSSGGCVLSEYPPGVGPERHHFPERNRIIAGLSLGVLVIEAPEKSGALITAYQALEYNREVFAVPGRIFDANSSGTNALLQRGAVLVTSVENILSPLGLEPRKKENTEENLQHLSENERRILEIIATEPRSIDSIVQTASLSLSVVAATLTTLELKGCVKEVGGKQYIRLE